MLKKYAKIEGFSDFFLSLFYRAEFASGWDFSRIPSPEEFGIGIFNFGLDRKIPKYRRSGSGFENPEKNPE